MIILVPAYQPGQRFLTLVTDLLDAGPGIHLVVVDDGGGPDFARVFDAARDLGCTVLSHPVNRGKGVALKTGFRHVAEVYPGHDVVCADADGQHSVTDIMRVADRVRATGRMVLGVRRFEGRVPLRSRVGNTITRRLFRAITGCPVQDTQTGLRAYPYGLLEWLGSVFGERFEYEMNVLLYATRAGHPIEEVEIVTTYLENNEGSHFGGFTDSARVYWQLLRFAASSRRRVASRSASR